MTFDKYNLGSKYPYFNRAYVVSSGFGCTHLYLGIKHLKHNLDDRYKTSFITKENNSYEPFTLQKSKTLTVFQEKMKSSVFILILFASLLSITLGKFDLNLHQLLNIGMVKKKYFVL